MDYDKRKESRRIKMIKMIEGDSKRREKDDKRGEKDSKRRGLIKKW